MIVLILCLTLFGFEKPLLIASVIGMSVYNVCAEGLTISGSRQTTKYYHDRLSALQRGALLNDL